MRNGLPALTDHQVKRLDRHTPFGTEIKIGERLQGLEAQAFFNQSAQYAVGYIRHTGVSADTETVTIDGRIYEYDTDGAITGDVVVDISGGNSATQSAAALAAAINGDSAAVVEAYVAPDTVTVVLVGKAAVTAFALATTVANSVISAAAMVGGRAAGDRYLAVGRYTVTARNVTDWAASGWVPIGCIDDPGSAPELLFDPQIIDSTGAIHSSATVLARVVRVNANNYAVIVSDPVGSIAAGEFIRWAVIA